MTLIEFLELNEAVTITKIVNSFGNLLGSTQKYSNLQKVPKDFQTWGRGVSSEGVSRIGSAKTMHASMGGQGRFYWGIKGSTLYIVPKKGYTSDVVDAIEDIKKKIQMKGLAIIPAGIKWTQPESESSFGKQKVDPIGQKIYNKIKDSKGLMRAEKFMNEYNSKKIPAETLEKLKTWAQAA